MISSRIAALLVALVLAADCARAEEFDVWIGTTRRPNAESKGIYHCRFDAESGKLTTPTLAAEIGSPGFVAMHPDKSVLYATGRQDGAESLSAYRIDDGNLTLTNSQPIGDGGAAHLTTDLAGKLLFSAQYGGGSVAVFPLLDDGSIGKRSQLVEHQGGSGVVDGRQDSPHPHWVGTSPDNRFLFVPDLGLDRVVIHKIDPAAGKLLPHAEGVSPPGGGPRHMKFHPNGKIAYVLNELTLSVTVFEYDTAAGTLSELQVIPTLSEAAKTKERFNSASEICVHPSGKYVYTANRGHDSISVFRTLDDTRLELVEVEPIRGSWPRNFNLDPTGRWLVAAGAESNTLSVFKIDPSSGELQYTLHSVYVPNPICVLFGNR